MALYRQGSLCSFKYQNVCMMENDTDGMDCVDDEAAAVLTQTQ